MSSSGSIFSQTLQEITNTKLQELSKRRAQFEQARSSILSVIEAEDNGVNRLVTLSDGIKRCFGIHLDKEQKVILKGTKHKLLEVELKNLDRFLGQANTDPSISPKMLAAMETSLIKHLDMQALQYQYAWLYGELVTEWLSGDKQEEAAGDVEMGEAFEDVGDAFKLESRMEWEKTVFEPADVDTKAITQYLDNLFGIGNKEKNVITDALDELRDSIYKFEQHISSPNQFSINSLKTVIQSLNSSDLLSDEKREVLRDFESNDMILKEIADVLNMRIGALSSWTWNSETPVPVEMRRKISGVYNIHMHEDLLQAIFLHYIGIKWSVFLKEAFKSFRCSESWNYPRKDISTHEQRRLGYYLGPLESTPTLHNLRIRVNSRRYFMAQLLDNFNEVMSGADGEEEADYERFAPESLKRKTGRARQTASKAARMAPQAPAQSKGKGVGQGGAKRHRRVVSDDTYQAEVTDYNNDEYDDEDNERSPIALKQKLLHMLSTEININTHLYGELTAFHSVFQDWNPKLPHDTVSTILRYFGVSDTWATFFRKFLEAPLKFMDDDDSTPGRKRRRGTPASHVLSDVFGEMTLFCLDFSVNQSTSSNLWRIHDNFWFWSNDHNLAVKAWKTVDEFAKVAGVEINPSKTGCVRIAKDNNTLPIDPSLPEGEIRWGFLRLSPETGRFEIDQKMVDSQVDDLYKQLQDKRKSILGFIQAWNTYAGTFFTSNFGKAANCFGREHVDNMLATHGKIESRVFSKLSEGKITSVAEYLKQALAERFGIKDVPDGYLYFPMELGGLDLQSPFIPLLQIRDQVVESPSKSIVEYQVAEQAAYKRYKTNFLNGTTKRERRNLDDCDWVPASQQDRENFMSYQEFARYREVYDFDHIDVDKALYRVFRELMQRPSESRVKTDNDRIDVALEQLEENGESSLRGITGGWDKLDAYWSWVATFYGGEILDRFGRLNIVQTELLPIAMVSLFRDKRVKWQG
ncbi:hypothetical protein F66182_2079 [Fusarium sp. NRRL 66182]|nr:hypothetical protein F66182_2079 [Fusarium sp. NRRL 66182]